MRPRDGKSKPQSALYFSGDPVAAHTLASAGSQIVRDLCETNNVVGFEESKDWIKPEYVNDFWRKYNESASFLKHADRDGSASYDFKPEETEYTLLFAIKWYRDLGNRPTPTMLLFATWFGACRPNVIAQGANDPMAQALRRASQHAQTLNRDERLKLGAGLIAETNAGVCIASSNFPERYIISQQSSAKSEAKSNASERDSESS